MILSNREEKPDLEPQLSLGIIILATGQGTRAGDVDPSKHNRRTTGETAISRIFRAFRSWNLDCPIVIVRKANDAPLLALAIRDRNENTYDTVGGATRQASCLQGLRFLAALDAAPSHVFIHDAIHSFVSRPLLERLEVSLTKVPQVGVIPAIPIVDTVKQVDPSGMVTGTVPRDGLYQSQTPQGFALQAILDVHEQAAQAGLTDYSDEASLFEWAGMAIRIVPGEDRNIKLTLQPDFEQAEHRPKVEDRVTIPDVRVGHGYDTHRLIPGTEMVLCGVKILHDSSLLGHSDADVSLHALTNALLATIAAGDIGSHFPPSDPQWKGVSSDRFLRHAGQLVRDAGGIITHCDVTLLCETPRISPYQDLMKDSVADILHLDRSRVSVKAGTNERIGFVGRQEGIVALATATAVFS
jgi:2-C-methyl-D-erythritol 4-phosphate cytidylyltransferase / 2-C-methyl-D-erythritol 2,4-cyclodiphosphate synthase